MKEYFGVILGGKKEPVTIHSSDMNGVHSKLHFTLAHTWKQRRGKKAGHEFALVHAWMFEFNNSKSFFPDMCVYRFIPIRARLSTTNGPLSASRFIIPSKKLFCDWVTKMFFALELHETDTFQSK